METQDSNGVNESANENEVGQKEEIDLLNRLCEQVFSGNRKELAVALGRSDDEVDDLLKGETPVDEDLVMKAHGLLQERALSET